MGIDCLKKINRELCLVLHIKVWLILNGKLTEHSGQAAGGRRIPPGHAADEALMMGNMLEHV